jgi:hypothetical protein
MIDIPPGLDRDSQELAKAIVASMLTEHDRTRPGPRTTGLLWSALDGIPEDLRALSLTEDQARSLEVKIVRVLTTLGMLADIASAAVTKLDSLGDDFRDQLATVYLLGADT